MRTRKPGLVSEGTGELLEDLRSKYKILKNNLVALTEPQDKNPLNQVLEYAQTRMGEEREKYDKTKNKEHLGYASAFSEMKNLIHFLKKQ